MSKKKILIILLTLTFFFSSSDATFAAGTNLSNTPLQPSYSPDIAVQESFVYVVWQESALGDIYFRRSTDGGNSFEPIQLLSGIFSGSEPNTAVSGTNVYVIWRHDYDKVAFTRSQDSGVTFETPKIIYQDSGGTLFPHLASGGNSVYITYESYRGPEYLGEIIFGYSLDNGITFTNPKNISNSPEGDSVDNWIAANDNDVYIVWVETPPGPVGIVFIATSHNSGKTFTHPKDIYTGDLDMSRVATNGKIVSVAWREPTTGTDDIMFTQSFNNGATFGEIINISNSPTVFSVNPELSMNSLGVTSIVWVEGGMTGVIPDIFLRQAFAGFLSAPINVSQTAKSSYWPTVGIDSFGNSYVAWQEHIDPTNPEIFFSKIIPQLP